MCMAKNVDCVPSIDPEKKEQFLKDTAESKAVEKLMARAAKHIPGFESRTIQRTRGIVNKMFVFDYDRHTDTFYAALGDKSNSYGDDATVEGLILMRDMDTEEITGFTILSFFKKISSNSLPTLPPSLNLSYEKDILPFIIR